MVFTLYRLTSFVFTNLGIFKINEFSTKLVYKNERFEQKVDELINKEITKG
jgi:hypothetical protein